MKIPKKISSTTYLTGYFGKVGVPFTLCLVNFKSLALELGSVGGEKFPVKITSV